MSVMGGGGGGVKYDRSQPKLWSMHRVLHRGECWCKIIFLCQFLSH